MIQNKVEQKILDFLKKKDKGASSSEISKVIGHNRITVTKYLEIMRVSGKLECEDLAQAKIWSVKGRNSKKKILIVDDEKHVVDLIALSLPSDEYDIFKAYSGLDALDLVHRKDPDLIILDIMMPSIDGYEVCSRIKSNPKFKKIPVIMLSAKFQTEDKVKGMEVGAEHYMVKPFDPIELEAKVRSVLRRAEDDIDSHSLTGLPGLKALDVDLKDKFKAILEDKNKSFLIKKFTVKDFGKLRNDIGFKKAEDLLVLLGRMFLDNTRKADCFVSHIVDESIIVVSKVNGKSDLKDDCDKFEKDIIKGVFRLFEFFFYENEEKKTPFVVEDYIFALGEYRYREKEYVSEKDCNESDLFSKKILKKNINEILDSDFSFDILENLK